MSWTLSRAQPPGMRRPLQRAAWQRWALLAAVRVPQPACVAVSGQDCSEHARASWAPARTALVALGARVWGRIAPG
eukprot:3950358-Alexandrium_andersonii.AAC.1